MPAYRLQLSHKPQLNPAAASCPVLSFFHSLNIPWLSIKQQFIGFNKGLKATVKVCVCVCVCMPVSVCLRVCVFCVCVCLWVCATVSGCVCVCVSLSVRVWIWIWHKIYNKLHRVQVTGVSAHWWKWSNWLGSTELKKQLDPELETGLHRRSERNERLQGMVAHDLSLSSGEAEARAYLWMWALTELSYRKTLSPKQNQRLKKKWYIGFRLEKAEPGQAWERRSEKLGS